MPSAASALRLQIETALGARIPGALTPRPRIVRDLAATGIPEIDALLEGGFPIGAISEMVGPQCSGRTSLALAALAEMTQQGKTVAWIDTSDTLDPESAAAAGVDLARQLWVRCGTDASTATSQGVAGAAVPDKGAAYLAEGRGTPATSGGCGSPHPRGEARGMPEALDAFLQPDVFSRPAPPRDPAQPRRDRSIGTPSAPNRKLLDRTPQDPRPIPRRARDREEQPPSDRQPSRRQAMLTEQHRSEAQQHADRAQQALGENQPKSLQAAQIAHTAARAQGNGPRGAQPTPGHWTDNRNNMQGRALHTAPNAIAAGLPRFREMEARASAASGPGSTSKRVPLIPLFTPGPAADGAQTQSAANPRKAGSSLAGDRPANLPRSASPVWQALDQALRATDLLLAAGGFSALVLDLGNVPAEFAWRIPLATWFRFRAAADRARTVLLVLTQHPCARSSAELVLRFGPAELQAAATVLTGAAFHIAVDRRRFETTAPHPLSKPAPEPSKLHLVSARKQPQRDSTWHRAAAWTGTDHPSTMPSRGPQ